MRECRAVLGEKLAPAAPSNACIPTDASHSDLPATPTEADWIASATKIMGTKDNLDDGEALSWAAYNATHQPELPARRPIGITAMLSMFKEKANTPTSMQHSMLLVKSAIDKLNPGQTLCITGDQPLFATMKTIQWHSDTPDALKENNYMVMMGALHIEMLIIALIGNRLKKSGWTEALSNAQIVSPGKAEGFSRLLTSPEQGIVMKYRHWFYQDLSKSLCDICGPL